MRTNQAVTIDNSKIYTSYFSKGCKIFPDRRLVSISITSAKNFNGSYARELNPSKELLWAYKNGEINTDQYIEWYTNTVLNNLNPFENLATHSRDFSHELVATYVSTKT